MEHASTILKVEERDLEILNEIAIKSKMHWGYPQEWLHLWRDDLQISQEYLNSNNSNIYKLLEKDRIVAFIALFEGHDFYEVEHLWVLPEHLGKGYGTLLLETVIGLIVEKGTEVRVVADPNAEEFYQKRGFITFDRTESSPAGRFLPVMKKKV